MSRYLEPLGFKILIINGVLNIAFAIKYDMLGLDVASVVRAVAAQIGPFSILAKRSIPAIILTVVRFGSRSQPLVLSTLPCALVCCCHLSVPK